jgi:uncharacterized repeat protein (TIGR03803 family)
VARFRGDAQISGFVKGGAKLDHGGGVKAGRKVIYAFQGSNDGASPYAGAVLDPDGNLDGTASYDGPDGAGTVFELTASNGSWTLTALHSFAGSEGPYGGIAMDAAGNLYGTTFVGDANQHGSVYKLTRSGVRADLQPPVRLHWRWRRARSVRHRGS